MRICPLASGSNGNCIYVECEGKHFLIDAGISRKRIVEGLESIGVMPEQLDGICITHEHSDHVSGLPVFLKKYPTDLYITEGTLAAIYPRIEAAIDSRLIHLVKADELVAVDKVRLMPFGTYHDAAEPVGYTIEGENEKFGMATDLGFYDDYIIRHLSNAQILLVEANHDISMLQAGTYPYMLKKRILGKQGHLSNVSAGDLLCELIHDKLQHVYLAHLSKDNNYPELAYETVRCQLKLKVPGKADGFTIEVAKRGEPSSVSVTPGGQGQTGGE